MNLPGGKLRYLLLQIIDTSIICFAWLIACNAFSASDPTSPSFRASLYSLPILLAVKILIFVKLGMYRAILRYASFHFANTILKACTLGSVLGYIIINSSTIKWPLGTLTLDWLLTLLLVGASRFFPRYRFEISKIFKSVRNNSNTKSVLVYGAGDLGDAVVRNLLRHPNEFKVLGLIDDNPRKLTRKVHNIPVLGRSFDLERIIYNNKIDEVIISISDIASEKLRSILKQCRHNNVFCRIAPKMSDMMDNNVFLKNIDISDLLRRSPKDLDENLISSSLRNKRVMITGAAGSIGSELANQISKFNPEQLLLTDMSEFGLYELEENLRRDYPTMFSDEKCKFALLQLCDSSPVIETVSKFQPDIIFHAAAYKHVPAVERSPCVGVNNNIASTVNIASAADKFDVGKFVLISTDKAVRPTNLMGASKRICELYVQNLNLKSTTEFISVRFGNVLGSSGSVIPRFVKQIAAGGPVTVTDPEVTRYFMLVQEAVALVMQAASIGNGGEIFILNMGEPVKIKDMAENLIYLAGKRPYIDIDIEFTGLRPGEKLYEELLLDDSEKITQYENITIGKTTVIDWELLNMNIDSLLAFAKSGNSLKMREQVKKLVPEMIVAEHDRIVRETNKEHEPDTSADNSAAFEKSAASL